MKDIGQKKHWCRYVFLKWLITLASNNHKIYWLIWGIIAAMVLCGNFSLESLGL